MPFTPDPSKIFDGWFHQMPPVLAQKGHCPYCKRDGEWLYLFEGPEQTATFLDEHLPLHAPKVDWVDDDGVAHYLPKDHPFRKIARQIPPES